MSASIKKIDKYFKTLRMQDDFVYIFYGFKLIFCLWFQMFATTD